MIQRALELKERRERERRAIVEEKRMQQYRYECCFFCLIVVFYERESHCECLLTGMCVGTFSESCDDCRVEDSRKVQKVVLSDRDKQLDERKQIEEEEVHSYCNVTSPVYTTSYVLNSHVLPIAETV